jgi:neutral ceramidase
MEMKAGTSKRVITPKEKRIQVFGMMSEGNEKDIYARCLTLSDGAQRLVFITYDLNCLDVGTPLLRERCARELEIPWSHLILLATHNHNAPIQIVPGNFDYGHWLAETMFDMIKEAIANERGPVTVKFGRGDMASLRNVGNTGMDTEVQLLGVYAGEAPLALLFNHPTHPMQGANGKVEPGHPGYACDAVEAAYPGALALYSAAAGGNQFALETADTGTPMAHAEHYGQTVAAEVVRIERAGMQDITGPIESAIEVISLPLAEPLSYEEAEKLAENIPRDIFRVPYPHPDRETNWIRVLLDYHEKNIPFPKKLDELVCTDDGFLVDKLDDGRKYPCRYEETIVSRIGPMAVVAMQGEVCAPIGMRVKDHFRPYFPIMVFAYMGEHNLYIPTRELVRQDAYQSQTLRIQYACPVDWDPSVEDVMTEGVMALVKKVMEHDVEEQIDIPHLAVRRGKA